MADMSLDELLSSSIKSAAEPAASKGVADAIRTRVDAGDTGTAVAGSTAPGWGGSAGGVLTIVAPIALIVVAGITGGALGASGVLGGSAAPVAGDFPVYVDSSDTAPIYSCPGGPQIGAIPASTRVLAVARDADGAFLGARDPGDLTSTIWFATGDLVLDADSPDPASLPVGECPEVTVTVVTPTPTPEPTQTAPPDDDENPPPAETTPPVISKMAATPTLIINGQPTQISVTASDNVGVTGVQLSWAITGNNGSGSMTGAGGVWTYVYSDNDLNDGFGNIVFTARAVDAAGNLSAPVQVVVNRQYLG